MMKDQARTLPERFKTQVGNGRIVITDAMTGLPSHTAELHAICGELMNPNPSALSVQIAVAAITHLAETTEVPAVSHHWLR
jgi:hypothetical protein